jgi:predicted MFS family arabinose efflux permease
MTNFTFIFAFVLAFNVGITILSSDWWKKRQQSSSTGDKTTTSSTTLTASSSSEEIENHKKWMELLKKYLIVYLLATLSDWMQGPYVYALYQNGYGYEQHDIAVLFVAGFGSSMIFGSFVGGMADAGGRRRFVILFAIIYAASCLTKRTFLHQKTICHTYKQLPVLTFFNILK